MNNHVRTASTRREVCAVCGAWIYPLEQHALYGEFADRLHLHCLPDPDERPWTIWDEGDRLYHEKADRDAEAYFERMDRDAAL